MNNPSSRNGGMQGLSPFPWHQRNNSTKRSAPILQWWYRITSPPEPDASAPFQERELFRRGRTGSQISIFLFLLIFISYPAAFAGSNSLLLVILTINLLFLALALVLNRFKMVNTAGIIVVLSVVMSPTVNILTTPGGVNTSALPIFGFLVLPLMCAVSFLPPGWVFVVAAGNCLFTLYVLRFVPSSGELHGVLQSAFPGIVTPIVLSQVIVSIVAFLWVRGARLALLRADRAEEIARLEHDLGTHAMERAEQKTRLEVSINLIIQTLVQVGNGVWEARVPLNNENVLWQISGSLNNLLGRLQHLRMEVSQLQQMGVTLQKSRDENAQLRNALQKSRDENAQLKNALQKSHDENAQPKNKLESRPLPPANEVSAEKSPMPRRVWEN